MRTWSRDRAGDNDSTLPRGPGHRQEVFERVLRTVAIGVMVAMIVAALLGMFGVRGRTVTASSASLRLDVRFAQITRPGLASPLSVTVRSSDGTALPEKLSIRVPADYVAMFDENGLSPAPLEEARNDTHTTWTFETHGDRTVLDVDFDARIEPGVQADRREGDVSLLVGDEEQLTVHIRSWVLP